MKTIQELNEILAEKLMGLKYDEFLKTWTEEMPAYFRKGIANVPTKLPDYTKNYQQILEKLLHNGQDCVITISTQFGYNVNYVDPYREFSVKDCKDLGEAICRCAVSYLENKEKE